LNKQAWHASPRESFAAFPHHLDYFVNMLGTESLLNKFHNSAQETFARRTCIVIGEIKTLGSTTVYSPAPGPFSLVLEEWTHAKI